VWRERCPNLHRDGALTSRQQRFRQQEKFNSSWIRKNISRSERGARSKSYLFTKLIAQTVRLTWLYSLSLIPKWRVFRWQKMTTFDGVVVDLLRSGFFFKIFPQTAVWAGFGRVAKHTIWMTLPQKLMSRKNTRTSFKTVLEIWSCHNTLEDIQMYKKVPSN